MGKDVHNQYYFYPGNAVSLIDVTSLYQKIHGWNEANSNW